jgi:glutathione S-transferase
VLAADLSPRAKMLLGACRFAADARVLAFRVAVPTTDAMELRYSPLSPYARKVRVCAHELGIAGRIRLVATSTRDDQAVLTPLNPLGKIPVLTTDAGDVLYDSPVICEYLDAEFGGHRLLPTSGAARWRTQTRAALADGLIDAAILVRHERARSDAQRSPEWEALQLGKVNRALDALDANAADWGDAFDLGHLGVACALGYIPLRLGEFAGFARWPGLRAWHERVSTRESLRSTTPVL